MAPHAAKVKKGANASAPEKAAHAEAASGRHHVSHASASGKGAHAKAVEKGICIICGEARSGVPAKPEFPIRAARWLRSVFRQPAKHTIACKEHMDEANAKRAKFEKKKRDYLLVAAAFFAFVLFGSLFFGRFDIGMAVPALLGALVIVFLPNFYYFPTFGK